MASEDDYDHIRRFTTDGELRKSQGDPTTVPKWRRFQADEGEGGALAAEDLLTTLNAKIDFGSLLTPIQPGVINH